MPTTATATTRPSNPDEPPPDELPLAHAFADFGSAKNTAANATTTATIQCFPRLPNRDDLMTASSVRGEHQQGAGHWYDHSIYRETKARSRSDPCDAAARCGRQPTPRRPAMARPSVT